MSGAREALAWTPSLRFTLPLLVAVIAALTATWVYYDGSRRAERRVEADATRDLTRSMTQLQWTLAHAQRRGQPEVFNDVIAELGADPSVAVAHIIGGGGVVRVSTRMAAVGEEPEVSSATRALFADARTRLAGVLRHGRGGDVIEAAYPLALDSPADRRDPARVGLLYVQRNLRASKAAETAEARRAQLQFFVIFFPLMVVFGVVVHRLVSARLGRLVAVTDRFASGEAIADVPVAGGDEVGQLARSFERMIHVREETEAAIRRLSRAIERSPIGIGMLSRRGEVDYGNDAFARWFRGCCAGHERRWMERVGRLASGDRSLAEAAAEGAEWHAEIARSVAGESCVEAVTVAPVRADHGGHFLVLVEDVTERRQAEEERSRLGLVVEQSTEAIVVTDRERRIDYVNPAFEASMQRSADEVRGWPIERLGDDSGEGAERYRTACAEVARTGAAWAGQLHNQRRDGSSFVVEATIAPVRVGGRLLGVASVQRDISRQLDLEEQLRHAQRMEAIGQLAGGIAHDFNNLLTVIIASCSFLGGQVSEAARHDVRNIAEAANRAAALTGQLLAFGRRQILKPVPVDMVELVETLGSLLDRLLREDIRLEVNMPPTLGPVRVDIAQMEQAIVNLCLNARDAMPRGGTIEIAGRVVEVTPEEAERRNLAPGPHALVEVRDTGEGIDPEVLPHVFEPFFTTKPVGEGTGLGLSMVYGIVTQSAGAVDVESTPGQGTRVRIYLPLAEGTARPLGAGFDPDAEPEEAAAQGAMVLVVEDDDLVRRVVSQMLRDDGHVVHLASSEDAAIELFESLDPRPDLLVTDVVLEQGSGVDLANELRRRDGGLRILFMSGYTPDDLGRAGLGDSAAVELLHKPFTPADLRQVVSDVLEREVPERADTD